MNKKITSIKQRIVQYIEYQGIAKTNFFNKIGMTPQSFRGPAMDSALNSDAVANILTEYPDINPYWLLMGEGEMLKKDIESPKTENLTSKEVNKIKKLEQELRDKEKIIEYLESILGIQKQSKAGKAS